MKSGKTGFSSIDEYIATFPEDIQAVLQELRGIIQSAAPDAHEKISYQMPAFALKGNLVYFAAWKNHIGFYPASGAVQDVFKEPLSHFKGTSGSIHFPLNKPLPVELIKQIVQFRVVEDLQHAEEKARKGKQD